MATKEEVSLRPMTFRPGGAANPFAGFGKGAGFGVKAKDVPAADTKEDRRRPDGERHRYTREFLMQFSETHMKLPAPLENSQIEIVLGNDDPDRVIQRQVIQRVAEDLDDGRDWRARQPLPELPAKETSATNTQQRGQDRDGFQRRDSANGPQRGPAGDGAQQRGGAGGAGAAAGPQQGAAAGGAAAGGAMSGPAPRIQTAAEKGLKAWAPGFASQGPDRALKQVKGILNKLTPEKFERLLTQLLEVVTTLQILEGTIRLVFESAVVQPTFVQVYAELCNRLSVELPQFPAPEGEDKPVSFRRVLLNTCQEEYEMIGEMREKLASQNVDAEEREFEERKIKSALLGNLRLIAELYKMDVVNEKIMHVCVQDLLGEPDSKVLPLEDNIEAVCEMLRISGSLLEKSEKSKLRLEKYFKQLDALGRVNALPSRIRFLIKDLVELRRSKWIPRRKQDTAKKISDIHAEAQAELGMIPTLANFANIAPDLPGLRQRAQADIELFPAFKGSDDGWEVVGKKKNAGHGGQMSALIGDYIPTPVVQRAAAPAAPAAPAAAPAAAEAAAPAAPASTALTNLTPEERESRTKSLFSEFLSSNDAAEALTCCRELMVEGYGPKLVGIGLEKMLDCTKEKEQAAVADVLVSFVKRNALPADDLVAGVEELTSQLEDLSLDVPYAARCLGEVLGMAIAGDHVPFDRAAALADSEKVESAEPRRTFWAAALKTVKSKGGEAKLKSAAAGADLEKLLGHDPEFDGDMPPVAEFLKSNGLGALA